MGLTISGVEKQPDGTIMVSVCARAFAHSVHFDADGYQAQDDYFHLAPGETLAVRLTPSPDDAEPAARIGVSALNAWSGAMIEVPR